MLFFNIPIKASSSKCLKIKNYYFYVFLGYKNGTLWSVPVNIIFVFIYLVNLWKIRIWLPFTEKKCFDSFS